MNSFSKTASVTAFVLALTLTTALAQEGDVEIVDPNSDWGENDLMPLPPGYETPFDELTEESFFGSFMVTNHSSSEICTMTMLPLDGDTESPLEFFVGDESGCLQSGYEVQVDYELEAVVCDVYIEFLNESYETIAGGETNHCETTFVTIN